MVWPSPEASHCVGAMISVQRSVLWMLNICDFCLGSFSCSVGNFVKVQLPALAGSQERPEGQGAHTSPPPAIDRGRQGGAAGLPSGGWCPRSTAGRLRHQQHPPRHQESPRSPRRPHFLPRRGGPAERTAGSTRPGARARLSSTWGSPRCSLGPERGSELLTPGSGSCCRRAVGLGLKLSPSRAAVRWPLGSPTVPGGEQGRS